MSKNVCVPIKSKLFKDLAKKLNINAESLEIAIKEWLNKGNEWSSDTDNILEEYLKKYFNINSTYYYSGKDIEKLKKAKVLIDSLDSNDVNTYRKAINVYNKAIKIFGKENVSLYKDYEGNYKVSISEPINNKEEFESNNIQERRTYIGLIDKLRPNQVFVFGSNTEGRHGAGAAKTAKDKFGAIYGQAEGPQGQSYAIITKDLTKDDKKHPSRTKEQIIEQIHKLYEYAKANPNKEFLVAYSSTGRNLNYYTNQEMAEMFANEEIPSNIVFEEGFNELVSNSNKTSNTITTPSRQETKEQN